MSLIKIGTDIGFGRTGLFSSTPSLTAWSSTPGFFTGRPQGSLEGDETRTNLIKTDLKSAAEHLQARYRSLTVYAKKLVDMSKSSGTPLPYAVMNEYNRAVDDYLRFGRDLFYELDKKKIKVRQIVYKDGEPVPDPNKPGFVKTREISAPLRPLTFIIPKDKPASVVGLAPLAIAGIAIGGLIFTSVAGYLGLGQIKQIVLALQGPNYEPDKRVNAFITCFDKLKSQGVDASAAMKECSSLKEQPKGSTWAPILLGIAAIVGGAFVVHQIAGARKAAV